MQFNKAKDLRPLRWSRSSGVRPLAALVLAIAALPGTFLRDPHPQRDNAGQVAIRAVPASPSGQLGPFRLDGVWRLSSTDKLFGGYSALLARPGGHLLAQSDRGAWLELAEPSTPAAPISAMPAMGYILRNPHVRDSIYDAEAVTTDPAGHIWVSWEDHQAISRFDRVPGADWPHERRAFPAALARWAPQFGAEAMARMPDGRFVIVNEGFVAHSLERRHQTLVFPADPTKRTRLQPVVGQLEADEGYRPTDIAMLPDGRMLVLLRRLLWPLPLRFSARIGLADPAELLWTGKWTARTLARLDSPLPTDNYEGLALRPRADGKLDVWVISDDNQASTQQTLLLKLQLDPRDLPQPSLPPPSR